ncbi:MAG: hypothetical protein ABI867_09115 [Kofleriaceae bacterium]
MRAALLALVACGSTPAPTPAPTPIEPAPAGGPPTIQIAAVTLAQECGRGPTPPLAGDADRTQSARVSACEQSSLQLAITSPAGAKPSRFRIKSLELFDAAGAHALGKLVWRTPSTWTGSAYAAWDERIPPGQALKISYALGAFDWSKIEGRYNQTYLVKAVISVDDKDTAVQHDVEVHARAQLPPDVDT